MPRTKVGLLLVLLVATACDEIKLPTEVIPPEDVIQVSRVDSGLLRADGASTVTIEARIPADAVTHTVTFKTSSGTFRGGTDTVTANIDTQGRATAVLVTPTAPGTATVTASITAGTNTFTGSTTLSFETAHPDTIVGEVSATTAAVDGSSKPVVSVFVSRASGKVSVGTPITFTATQVTPSGTRSVGRFFGIDTMRVNADGKASASFAADTGDVTPGVPVTIRASSVNDSGAPVVFETTIGVK